MSYVPKFIFFQAILSIECGSLRADQGASRVSLAGIRVWLRGANHVVRYGVSALLVLLAAVPVVQDLQRGELQHVRTEPTRPSGAPA